MSDDVNYGVNGGLHAVGHLLYVAIFLAEVRFMGSNKRLWTRQDYEFLRDNYRKMSANKMAEYLDRMPGAVRVRLNGWGISTPFFISCDDGSVTKYLRFKIPD